jgi:hypothetical protein
MHHSIDHFSWPGEWWKNDGSVALTNNVDQQLNMKKKSHLTSQDLYFNFFPDVNFQLCFHVVHDGHLQKVQVQCKRKGASAHRTSLHLFLGIVLLPFFIYSFFFSFLLLLFILSSVLFSNM